MEYSQKMQIVKNLRYSMENQTLVNVIQTGSSIFYTGTVFGVDRNGTILSTFTEDGLSNGFVYLDYNDIFDVDFYSEDLTKMEERIKMARNLHLISAEQPDLQLNDKGALLTQVLGSSFVYQRPILLIKEDDTMMEGFVSSLSDNEVELTTFDKFDSSEAKHARMPLYDIKLIEFLGQELNLLEHSKKLLMTGHVESQDIGGDLEIFAALHQALESGRRIIMIPKINPELFFIGQVRAVNADSVVFAVVDMNGQFGGYELIRLNEISHLEIKSDYLRLINHFVSLNMAHDTFLQPLLNNERSFDSTVDQFVGVINQAIKFKRFLRIKSNEGETYFGVPFKFEKGTVSVRYLDKDKPNEPQLIELSVNDIDELAFDYLDAFLAKKRIMGMD
ncbi:hypothetical protein EQU06_02955 [Lactobacillus sanfranciscensis]|uniref:Uncharacterized protein n=1 Tax=Fructilactobacillus sanfranciscensis (strain TMW 1.1304) TaxID=714313 RepID=G2KTE6_FRUST|nr:hypothetical protein [Fructilactobacillus sanfranciscensis]AEN98762.1 hypothetical protein LSA_03060 [Fructilactobacillus sanfranciscensis TMW 1.1304]NDR75675.1 hypothetical protein [Fructilactobacillus sanfranciscensis]NDR96529.1 hypothetical protein [Fructilactobacillus sanfranciscensis]NDS04342.1 hypothetical protein [Fructilactobacillus sanfranciscensis]POH17344.1 hypothetical protein BGL44_03645 [Fructilactobacillus sanfranciscensis]